MLGLQLMPAVCRSEAEENRAECWVYNLCPQFARGSSIRFSKSLEYILL